MIVFILFINMIDEKIPKQDKNPWTNFFGKPIDDPSLKNIYKDNYKVKEIKEYIYIRNHEEGFELCFKNKALDSVFLFNQGINPFKRYEGKLPYNLNWNLILPYIIELLGDTNKKHGGRTPICLNYPHLGLELNFLQCSWDDPRNPLTSITLFREDDKELNCSVCLKKVKDKEDNKCDNRCGLVNYCSRQCLEIHINSHKKYCL